MSFLHRVHRLWITIPILLVATLTQAPLHGRSNTRQHQLACSRSMLLCNRGIVLAAASSPDRETCAHVFTATRARILRTAVCTPRQHEEAVAQPAFSCKRCHGGSVHARGGLGRCRPRHRLCGVQLLVQRRVRQARDRLQQDRWHQRHGAHAWPALRRVSGCVNLHLLSAFLQARVHSSL